MTLDEYRQKRSFARTPEPQGEPAAEGNQWRFVVQKHAASRLHYDLRLEFNGVLLSWAVPKGPSLDWADKRLAIHVEDHPLEYLAFEGVIPGDEYGGGTVMVWDLGRWTPRSDAAKDYLAGELKFDLDGQKLHGGWMLKRLKNAEPNQWLWIKEKDSAMRDSLDFDVLQEYPDSVLTGRSLAKIAAEKTAVWSSKPRDVEMYSLDTDRFPHARQSSLPPLIRPCQPTAVRHAPQGDQWVHEIKYDGYRMIGRISAGSARFQSRSGKDWTDRLATLARAVAALPCESAVLDGEVVMLNDAGIASFQALQNRVGAGRDTELRYCVFDLLYIDGYDVTKLTLLERKQILVELFERHGPGGRLMFSEHMTGDGPTIYRQACKLGAEGIVSKHAHKRYAEGRFEFWRKLKCLQSREFLIGGFTPASNSRRGFGAILLGVPREDGRQHFLGKVGTGFSEDTLIRLREQMDELEIPKSPFHNLDRRQADKGTVWVTPTLVAEIEFAGWTNDGLIRFGSFRGLRDDIGVDDIDLSLPTPDEPTVAFSSSGPQTPARDVSVEPALDLPDEIAQVRISHPNRPVYPEMGITKLGVATYYAQVGRWMLPQIVGRPVSLYRCPGGIAETCFFQKRAPQGLDESVEQIELPTGEGERLFMVIHDLVGLLSLVQFGVLEFHISGARADKIERPDRLVFDLDPAHDVPWSRTVNAALELRGWLEDVGLASFVKTTGGKGLHIVVPIRRRHTWDEAKHFTKQVAVQFEQRWPRRFTTNPAKKARQGRILIDTLRNARSATAVAAYSTRANPKAAVSVPITWAELTTIPSSGHFSLQDVLARLADHEQVPWEGISDVAQSITKRARGKLG